MHATKASMQVRQQDESAGEESATPTNEAEGEPSESGVDMRSLLGTQPLVKRQLRTLRWV